MEPRPPWTADPTPAPSVTDELAPTAAVDAVDAPLDEPTDVATEGPTEGRPSLDLDAVTADLAAVEAALERLDQGGYGRCGACASAIDDDVLAADPTATTCAAHLPV